MTALPRPVLDLAASVAEANGAHVLEARLRGRGRATVLSVVLDADEPLEADTVERISRELSHQLDTADPVPGSYTLEVTTPGLDRPLRTGADYRRQVGHEVRLRHRARDRDETLEGIVLGANEDSVTIDAGGPHTVPLTDVVSGRVVLPW